MATTHIPCIYSYLPNRFGIQTKSWKLWCILYSTCLFSSFINMRGFSLVPHLTEAYMLRRIKSGTVHRIRSTSHQCPKRSRRLRLSWKSRVNLRKFNVPKDWYNEIVLESREWILEANFLLTSCQVIAMLVPGTATYLQFCGRFCSYYVLNCPVANAWLYEIYTSGHWYWLSGHKDRESDNKQEHWERYGSGRNLPRHHSHHISVCLILWQRVTFRQSFHVLASIVKGSESA
jgi:hypothetical protein